MNKITHLEGHENIFNFTYNHKSGIIRFVVILDMFNIKIVISDEGLWYIYLNSILYSFEEKHAISFFPFLELGCEKFVALITENLGQKMLSENLIKSFPIKNIIILAINMNSDYWTKLSISWLNCFSIDYEISKILSSVMYSLHFSQSTRHLAKRMFFTFNR